jgi:predicted ATPase
MQDVQQSNLSLIDRIETNWCVITGAPCAGKSSTISELKARGYSTIDEYSREYYEDMRRVFEARELDISDLRADINIPINQERIYEKRIEIAEKLDPAAAIFFDSAIPDSLLRLEMYRDQHLPIADDLIRRAKEESWRYKYKKIFHLEPVPFEADGIRIEDPQSVLILHQLTCRVYEDLGYPVISVPRFSSDKHESIKRRVDFILSESSSL